MLSRFLTRGALPNSFSLRLLPRVTFSSPFPSFSRGSRHSPFLSIDRLSLFQRSADLLNFDSALLNRLGQRELLTSPPNFSSAADFFIESAREGNADAQCTLGILHHVGRGVRIDPAAATEYFRQAAGQGSARGKYCFGLCLRAGLGVRPDLAQGMAQLRSAAEEGYEEAMFAYGRSLLDRDEKTAFSLFEKGAQNGHAPSMLWQGVCLHDGIGVEKDRARAVSLFRKASSRGMPEAKEALRMAMKWRSEEGTK
jgi:TPR repeat protein